MASVKITKLKTKTILAGFQLLQSCCHRRHLVHKNISQHFIWQIIIFILFTICISHIFHLSQLMKNYLISVKNYLSINGWCEHHGDVPSTDNNMIGVRPGRVGVEPVWEPGTHHAGPLCCPSVHWSYRAIHVMLYSWKMSGVSYYVLRYHVYELISMSGWLSLSHSLAALDTITA